MVLFANWEREPVDAGLKKARACMRVACYLCFEKGEELQVTKRRLRRREEGG